MKKTLVLLVFLIFCHVAYAEDVDRDIKIYVADMKPCVIVKPSENSHTPASISGFEIDLWNEIAKDLAAQGIIQNWEFIPVQWGELEDNIRNKNADVACAGITIRSKRMDWADFSVPTMNSGLGIMVLNNKEVETIWFKLGLLWGALSIPILLFICFILIFSNIIWLADKGGGGISNKYFPGIFEAIYFSIVTCSTVGYGDYTPKKWITKIITVVLIFCGIIAFCNFTALLSADYTTEKTTGSIQSPSDLKGKVVLTQKGTTSVDYVKGLGASKIKTVDNINTACDYLLLERGDAVVFDYPVLLNYAKENVDKVKIVDGLFDEQYYGYIFPKGSKLKRVVDVALLKIYENGTYMRLYKKWF